MSSKTPRKKNLSALRMLGTQVQLARRATGYTQRSLAEKVLVDEETIASIEQGRRALMPDLADTLDDLLATKGVLAGGVSKLPEIDQFPVYAEDYPFHEREAIALGLYDNAVVPGLLQTAEYAHAVFSSHAPSYTEDHIAELTANRLERQELLHRKEPPSVSFVIWEPALLFPLGGRDVHRAQINHLRRSAEIPRVTLQVLPLNRTTHAGTGGAFTLMETVSHQHIAYTAAHQGSRLIADPQHVSILSRKHAMLRSQALSPEDSMDRLDRLLGEL